MRARRILITLFAATAASAPAAGFAQPEMAAPTRSVPPSAAAMKVSFAPVVQKAAPAVVNISAKRLVRQTDPFWELFGLGAPRGRIEGSLGSGVIVREDGVIVTNNHVVQGGQEITVALADRREFPARILLADPRTDLAVLKIDTGGQRLPTLAIDDSGDAQVGDLVLAIGNPFGVGQTVTNGIISALNRTADPTGDAASAYIQTDAAINPGNSGGALVDMDGDLIGINSFILSRSGTSSGVGFAVPAAMVRQVVEAAVGGGRAVVRPWLGARTQPITAEIARALNLPTPQGALVADLWPNGPAARSGLQQGDVVISIDGDPVVDPAALNYAIGARRPGETVTLEVLDADGRRRQARLRADAPPATPARDERTLSGRNPFDGMTVVNLSPAVAAELGVDPFSGPGVLVTGIRGGFSRSTGIRPGDFIRSVNGRRIESVADLAAAAASGVRAWQVVIQRGSQEATLTFRL
ncbi:MAG: Do family serine endopeptidase [Phenylobacterium sp.]|jgi:Do/DeqQ family serine protease|uniref:Do family serine endopeptidase n=1 Tax=Phenylobacterium sp. TaxID=1871053 RepID=UPI002A35EB01|nr:Do family serine endopeptidase [Phenylobacterium sp.]MDX9996690.1 Do family serine endopeptidase [Phenylobacterium sp.]